MIEKKAKEGNCVIVGRGAPYILRARPDAFHLFVYGSREDKIRRLIKLKMSEKDATEMVDTIDRERAAFVRKYFDAEWPCRRLYHLMLNSDHGIEHVTNIVLSTMESLEREGKHGAAGQGRKSRASAAIGAIAQPLTFARAGQFESLRTTSPAEPPFSPRPFSLSPSLVTTAV